jgi:hypothetical protein
MAAIRKGFRHAELPVLADQRPIVRSEPVMPRETAEFDSDGLAGGRQWTKPTPFCRSPTAAIGGFPKVHDRFFTTFAWCVPMLFTVET